MNKEEKQLLIDYLHAVRNNSPGVVSYLMATKYRDKSHADILSMIDKIVEEIQK